MSVGSQREERFRRSRQSGPSTEAVAGLYRLVLGREPEETDVALYKSLIDGGWAPSDVLAAMIASQEAQRSAPPADGSRGGLSAPKDRRQVEKLVHLIYGLLLRRPPDPAGLQSWTDRLMAGMEWDELIGSAMASAEYAERESEGRSITQLLRTLDDLGDVMGRVVEMTSTIERLDRRIGDLLSDRWEQNALNARLTHLEDRLLAEPPTG